VELETNNPTLYVPVLVEPWRSGVKEASGDWRDREGLICPPNASSLLSLWPEQEGPPLRGHQDNPRLKQPEYWDGTCLIRESPSPALCQEGHPERKGISGLVESENIWKMFDSKSVPECHPKDPQSEPLSGKHCIIISQFNWQDFHVRAMCQVVITNHSLQSKSLLLKISRTDFVSTGDWLQDSTPPRFHSSWMLGPLV
jgi:hypothetical protein